jgi:putative proteasome-type protease
MTYCLAIRLDSGLVFASDSRTNAGMDQISSYSKMYAFTSGGDRAFVLLNSGNLATTQGVVNHIRHALYEQDEKNNFKSFKYMFDVADYIGELNRHVQGRDRNIPQQENTNLEASFILGGQIGEEEPEIYLIYPEGNYISVSPTKPYLQIGETKYGKPILDRIVTPEISLEDAARCALVSLDSTMRSNLSVGPPFELVICPKDQYQITHHLKLDVESPLYLAMTKGWSDGLKDAFTKLPRFEWE